MIVSAPLAVESSRQQRLLLVIDSLDVGGAERHVVGLGTALRQAGFAVTLACATSGVLTEAAVAAGLQVNVLLDHPVKRHLDGGFAWALSRLLQRQQFDLVHAHLYASATAAGLATLGSGVPLVITEHSEAGWRTSLARMCSRLAYRRAAHVIAVSNAIRRRLVDEDGVPDQRVSVVPNALFPVIGPSAVTAPLSATGNGPRIGVVGRLQPEKGIAYFIESAAAVAAALPAAEFFVIGDGPQRQELIALSAQRGLGDRIRFLGFRVDAPALIGGLDLLAVPSLSEGTPLVVLEAMAAGVPVVASAVGGIPDQIHMGARDCWCRPPTRSRSAPRCSPWRRRVTVPVTWAYPASGGSRPTLVSTPCFGVRRPSIGAVCHASWCRVSAAMKQ